MKELFVLLSIALCAWIFAFSVFTVINYNQFPSYFGDAKGIKPGMGIVGVWRMKSVRENDFLTPEQKEEQYSRINAIVLEVRGNDIKIQYCKGGIDIITPSQLIWYDELQFVENGSCK